ncbi:MarR family winged helix-turn-helix transcriptional regulator [Kineosporia rhizophila]|uniref:MarR family winged helix-turn-helix transcriptional regulator n=1 Tax=Kineosporia rhizophila TaxID=84633 RepID=UPI000AAE7949|nr:MarR family winged helix-turn-helix transcriptional regulator [Kineosporia rhizophila]MCE0539564.1 MarR family winged helix-turn-helix transcriptional regulator [Kineosporia rhizophila]
MQSDLRTSVAGPRGRLLEAVLGEVRPLVLNSARALEALWRPEGVTVGMRAVLQILQQQGPLTVPAIAERLDLARQGVQRHVNDLAALHLVVSQTNPGHRRSVLIAVTGQGRDVFARLMTAERERLEGHTALDCSAEDLQTALRVLQALNRDVRAHAQQLREALPQENP